MADHPDRRAQPMDDIMISNPPDPSDEKSTSQSLINDINGLTKQITEKGNEITPQFLEGATREQITVAKLEFKTLRDLHASKIIDLSREELTQEIIDQLKRNQDEVETIGKRVNEMFETSKYQIASSHKATLSNIYTKLREIREFVTVDFLAESSVKKLEETRSEIAETFGDFAQKYSQLVLDDLSSSEREEILQQKAYIETATKNVDKFIQNAIKAKEIEAERKSTEQQKLSETPNLEDPQVGSSHHHKKSDQTEQIEKLSKQLAELAKKHQTEKEQTAEIIKSLEGKFSNAFHGDLDGSEDIFEDLSDRMIGNPAGEQEAVIEQAVAGIKIGSIDMSTFGGNLEEWEAFRDLFEHLVHNSKKMSKTVKFYQLRTHLKGPALDTIRGYQVTGSNYDAAWEDLKKRYNRTDELINEYIRKFFEARPVENKATSGALRKVIDFTNQMLRALPNLGAKVENWDPIVNLIICSKLNEDLRSGWEQKKERDDLKLTKDLLKYLEGKAIELQPKQSDRLSQMLKGDNRRTQPRRVFQINEKKVEKEKPQQDGEKKNKCLICGGNHKIRNCFKFKRECAKVRTEIVKSLKLCFKCLLKHQIGLCDQEDCNYCGKPHDVMLCYKKENDENSRFEQSKAGPSKAWAPAMPSRAQPTAEQRVFVTSERNSTQKKRKMSVRQDEDDWDSPSKNEN